MLRKFLITAVMVLAAAGCLYAVQGVQDEFELKLWTNREFLKAAAKIVAEDRSSEGAAILKLAVESHDEALSRIKSGDIESARVAIDDSTKKAVNAIILSKNTNDDSIRDTVIKEEVARLAVRERERKEAQLKKGVAEVEIFITAAERLLKDEPNEKAAMMLKETRTTYAAAKEKMALGDYDGALEDVSRAYKLSTDSVKEIKHSQGGMLTFPKAVYGDPKEVLAHELKKNDAYAFFVTTMVKEGQDEPARLVSEGLSYRDKAVKAMKQGGETQAAIDGLKASTELLIQALRAAGN
jgi:hypothetical protein